MSINRRLIAGNWKMNTSQAEATALTQEIIDRIDSAHVPVVLGVPFVYLHELSQLLRGHSNIAVAAQNCHHAAAGAYTGEVSAAMLASVGVDYVILGHSERREYFGETDDLIHTKIKQVLEHGMRPIYCCGEKLDIRDADQQNEVVGQQVAAALYGLAASELRQCVIAYEPVWAIGTGRTASPEQAQAMHAHIRGLIREQFGNEVADGLTILYGGSMKPDNAAELIAQPDVDGGLVGGASLQAADFVTIIRAAT